MPCWRHTLDESIFHSPRPDHTAGGYCSVRNLIHPDHNNDPEHYHYYAICIGCMKVVEKFFFKYGTPLCVGWQRIRWQEMFGTGLGECKNKTACRPPKMDCPQYFNDESPPPYSKQDPSVQYLFLPDGSHYEHRQGMRHFWSGAVVRRLQSSRMYSIFLHNNAKSWSWILAYGNECSNVYGSLTCQKGACFAREIRRQSSSQHHITGFSNLRRFYCLLIVRQ